ncbi:hypothetical protein ACWKWU_06325 [Chitinophaga lutea]
MMSIIVLANVALICACLYKPKARPAKDAEPEGWMIPAFTALILLSMALAIAAPVVMAPLSHIIPIWWKKRKRVNAVAEE